MSTFWTLLLLLFRNAPTGQSQTRRRIFTLDGSSDADLRKGVPVAGFVDIAWVKSLKTANFVGANRRFQAMGAKY